MLNPPKNAQDCWLTGSRLTRRSLIKAITGTALIGAFNGCVASLTTSAMPDKIWGKRGLSEGKFLKPRAMVCTPEDQIFIVDMTGRIQAFDTDGNFLTGWRTPLIEQGKPTGLGLALDGTLIVADTHYFRVLFYAQDGQLQDEKTIGGVHGDAPGEFHFVTDVVQHPNGNYFIGQYGQIDRIQEYSPTGKLIRAWGTQGSGAKEFSRPQALAIDDLGLLWVADACNHRFQVFDVSRSDPTDANQPELVSIWGEMGPAPGQLKYPYAIDFDESGNLFVAEFGNHRIQKFDRSGSSLGILGSAGSTAGKLNSPWGVIVDSQGRLHVLDTMNHRVQRFPASVVLERPVE